MYQYERHHDFYVIIDEGDTVEDIDRDEAEYNEDFPDDSDHGDRSSSTLDWTEETIDVSSYSGVVPIVFLLRHSMSETEDADEEAWIWGLEFDD